MLKNLLTELRDVIAHLERAGYFRVAPERKVVRVGKTTDGRRVVKYSDGTFEVAPGHATRERAQTSDAPLVAVGITPQHTHPEQKPRKQIEQKPREKGRKLTRADAVDIYNEDRMSFADLAEIYSVSVSTIIQIKQGYTWWKVTGATPHPRRRSVMRKKSQP